MTKLTVERNALSKLLGRVVKAVESRNSIPILGNVKIDNAGGRLSATATDLEIVMTGTIDAAGDDTSFTVDAKMLAGIVNQLPAGSEITITVDDNAVQIAAGASRFKLSSLPVGDYPDLEDGAYDTAFTVDLAALVAPVAFAMSKEAARYYLCGVYLHTDDNALVAVATDGHRIARNATAAVAAPAGVILPAKLVGMLPEGEVALSIGATKVRIETGAITITSRVIDGSYPDYKRVIPIGNDRLATIDRDALTTAARRVSIAHMGDSHGVKMFLSGGKIALSASGGAEAYDEIDAAWSGENLEIGVNSLYLIDVLGVLPPGGVDVALSDSASPMLFTSKSAPEFLAVVMPMRV